MYPNFAGYNVYYGSNSRDYTNSVSAGAATSVTISNLTPGVTYYFAATTFNIDGLESDFSGEASYTPPLPPLNWPPTLDPVADIVIDESTGPQSVALSGIGSGSSSEQQLLTVSAFSSNPNLIPNPTVDYISPQVTGTLDFTPVTGSFGSVIMTVMVDDGGVVSNTVIRSFTITVNPVNDPPTLDALNNLVLNENSGPQQVSLSGISAGPANEGQPVTVTATSSNPSLIPNPAVSYQSPNPTGSLTISPTTNAFGSATITVTVNDSQATNGVVSRSFNVTVNQVVTTPNTLTNAIIAPNEVFRFTLVPPYNNGHHFTYSLDATAPAGAKISNRRGVYSLVWVPTSAQASTTNLINIRVNDTTTPALSTNEYVQVIVLDYLNVFSGLSAVQTGQTLTVPLISLSSDGLTNLSFTVGYPTNRFSNPALTILSPTTLAGTIQPQGTNLLVRIRTLSSQVLDGSNLVAQINFQTASSQSSAFVSLPIRNVSGTKPTGLGYVDNTAQPAQVVVVSDVPLLQSTASGSNRLLKLYGRVGTTYQLESTTNLLVPSAWSAVTSYVQTNVAQTFNADSTRPIIFYRLKQQ